MAMINRKIWTLWFQGYDKAPPIIGACLESWRRINPTWEIVPLCAKSLAATLKNDEAFNLVADREISLAGQSDLARIALLKNFGGVWVDSTTFCLQPLDSWLTSKAELGFFAFDRPAHDRMIASWFLAGNTSNYVIEQYYNACLGFWKTRQKSNDYFWFHHIFNHLYKMDAKIKNLWDETPKLSAEGPHYFVPYAKHLCRPLTHSDIDLFTNGEVPLLKLTHKIHCNVQNSVYQYLCNNASPLG